MKKLILFFSLFSYGLQAQYIDTMVFRFTNGDIKYYQVRNITRDKSKLGLGTLATQSGTFSGSHSGTSSGTNTGDQTTFTGFTGNIPFANTGGSSAATSATTGTITVNMVTPIVTITPTGTCTFNASGGVTGQRMSFVITTGGISSFTLTWGTNFKTTATLATGTTSGKTFVMSFLCTNGTQWIETGRTTAQ